MPLQYRNLHAHTGHMSRSPDKARLQYAPRVPSSSAGIRPDIMTICGVGMRYILRPRNPMHITSVISSQYELSCFLHVLSYPLVVGSFLRLQRIREPWSFAPSIDISDLFREHRSQLQCQCHTSGRPTRLYFHVCASALVVLSNLRVSLDYQDCSEEASSQTQQEERLPHRPQTPSTTQ